VISTLPMPRHSVSVAGAVIDRHGRMLAIRRRDNGHWEPPGGVLELGETVEEGLVREICEETGLTVVPERLTGVYKNMEQAVVALVFRCSVRGEATARTGAEASEVAWLTLDEIERRMDEAYATRLLDALLSTPPAVRAHNGVTLRERDLPRVESRAHDLRDALVIGPDRIS
jgi:8-oxo-dGTP diphosphatase